MANPKTFGSDYGRGLEAARKIVLAERLSDNTGEESDRAYNLAIDHAAAAIYRSIPKKK